MFHVLRRNGFRNYLLCPLGGVGVDEVDWGSINRTFQSHVNLDFNSLGYDGPRLPFFVKDDWYAPPDEFSLNRAYEMASAESNGPFSLFFLTQNSHFPYNSPLAPAGDWRRLSDPDATISLTRDQGGSMADNYVGSMRYQIDFINRFVQSRSRDNTVFVVFGDHQPPMLATDRHGPDTQVHVIASNERFIETFREAGYVPSLHLADDAKVFCHEAFLSLFIAGMLAGFGNRKGVEVPILEEGVRL